MSIDDAVGVALAAREAGRVEGIAEERERWENAIYNERHDRWENVSSSAVEALFGVLQRMGIAQ